MAGPRRAELARGHAGSRGVPRRGRPRHQLRESCGESDGVAAGTGLLPARGGAVRFALWLPQLVKASGTFTNFEVGVITAIPYAIAAIGMVLVGRRSDRTGERHWHLTLPALAGALGFLTVTRIGSIGPLVAALSLTAFGVLGWLGPFWSMPTAMLKEQAAAGGIALVNSMGAVGGFVGPYVLGQVKQHTGSFTGGLLILGACQVASAVIVIVLEQRRTKATEG